MKHKNPLLIICHAYVLEISCKASGVTMEECVLELIFKLRGVSEPLAFIYVFTV